MVYHCITESVSLSFVSESVCLCFGLIPELVCLCPLKLQSITRHQQVHFFENFTRTAGTDGCQFVLQSLEPSRKRSIGQAFEKAIKQPPIRAAPHRLSFGLGALILQQQKSKPKPIGPAKRKPAVDQSNASNKSNFCDPLEESSAANTSSGSRDLPSRPWF